MSMLWQTLPFITILSNFNFKLYRFSWTNSCYEEIILIFSACPYTIPLKTLGGCADEQWRYNCGFVGFTQSSIHSPWENAMIINFVALKRILKPYISDILCLSAFVRPDDCKSKRTICLNVDFNLLLTRIPLFWWTEFTSFTVGTLD